MKKICWLGLALACFTPHALASSIHSTGFESSEGWSLGLAEDQNGWDRNLNANHYGRIQTNTVKTGTQALELRTLDTQSAQDTMQGVINGLRTATVDKAGESTTVNGPRVNNRMKIGFWFRTPDAQLPVTSLALSDPTNYEDPYGGIVELNPSFSQGDSGSRYASLTLYDATQDRMGYYNPSQGLLLELSTAQNYSNSVAWEFDVLSQNLSYASWYRLEYDITLVDGTNNDETPNDILTVSIFDSSNVFMNSVTNSTWESPFRSAFGTGAYSLDTFSFRGLRQTADLNLGYVDDLTIESVPEPMTMSLLALGALAARRRKKA
ncbi:MAG: PEP-CTERM sorting domain-containing protein [Armatimonadetes bacterium]|nr:PEP-CTERM sorting domain-containing protein [Armatimonadota bacterium]